MPQKLLRAHEAAEVASAEQLFDRILQSEKDARRIRRKAEKAGEYQACVGAIRELSRLVTILAAIAREAQEQEHQRDFQVTVTYESRPELPDIPEPPREARLLPAPQARCEVIPNH